MDDMTALDRLLTSEVRREAGPSQPVNDAAIFTAITATQSPKWRFQSMFSATKFVVAGAIVALFGGFLLAGVLTQPSEETAPAATTDAPGTFSSTGALVEPRFCCRDIIPLRDGRVLVFGGSSAEVWDPEAGTFSPAGTSGLFDEGRGGATTTLLPDGRVLMVGGGTWADQLSDPEFDPDAEAEVWDPATEAFHAAGSLVHERRLHSAALLPDGRVLIVGGANENGEVATAEVWDPETMSFGPAGSLNETRVADLTTIVLPDGRVLVAGGGYGYERVRTAEVWDPETATFSLAGSLAELDPNSPFTATLLEDGRVLFVGGGRVLDAEIWNPETNSFGPGGSLAEAGGSYHTATRLADGRVLVIGGWRGSGWNQIAAAELWDPESMSFGPAGSLAEPRSTHRATLLPDGRVLVVGGGDENGEVAAAEIWDPESKSFSPAGSLSEARIVQSATLLPDGRVLVLSTDETFTTAEVWSP